MSNTREAGKGLGTEATSATTDSQLVTDARAAHTAASAQEMRQASDDSSNVSVSQTDTGLPPSASGAVSRVAIAVAVYIFPGILGRRRVDSGG